MLRRVAVCTAFATWCFLNTWVELAEGESRYFARRNPFASIVVPVLCCEFLIAAAMFAVWEFFRMKRVQREASAHIVFLALCLFPLGIASIAALRVTPLDLVPVIRNRWFWPAVLLTGIAPAIFAVARPFAASRLMRGVLLYSWPLLVVVLFAAARRGPLAEPASAYEDGPLARPFDPAAHDVRFIWIIFDELSEAVAFSNRPAGLQLPNLDRLSAESLHASSAFAPAGSTELSIPGLILGETVIAATPDGARALNVRTNSRPAMFSWTSAPNIFDGARAEGFNTAVVGWYHPYCRVLNHSLTECYWTSAWLRSGVEERFYPATFAGAIVDRFRLQIAALPLVGHVPFLLPSSYQREERIARYAALRHRALAVAADPHIGLALLHLPVPHPPGIYNRAAGSLTAKGGGYLENLALVDRTFGELRAAMERASVWNRTAVLVSSDHGWRTYAWRGNQDWTAEDEAAASNLDTSAVPFLLKLPAQTEGLKYARRVDTVVSRELITRVLKGSLKDYTAVKNFLDWH